MRLSQSDGNLPRAGPVTAPIGGFQRALPFFLGLMLGQFITGSLWNIYGIIRDLPTYQFWQ